MKTRIALCLAALAPAVAPAAPTELSPIQVTADAQPRRAHEAQQAVSVVEGGPVGPRTVPDMLRRTPGVYVQQTTPGQGVAIIRGLKGSEVLHLVDGVRLNHAFFRNAPNQYLALVDGQMLERIEVVRGPAPTLYGSDAMGGVVQLLSRTPDFHTAPGGTWRGHLRSAYASADGASLARSHSEWASRDLAIGLGLTYQDHQRRRNGDGADLPQSDWSARAADLNLRLAAVDNAELRLKLQHLRQPSTPRFDQLNPGFGQTEPERAEFSFEPSQRDMGLLQGRFLNLGVAADRLIVSLAWQRMIDDTRRRSLGSDQRRLERNRSKAVSLQLRATSQLSNDLSLSYGFEANQDEVESSRQRVNLTDGSSRPDAARFPDGARLQRVAAYTQHSWQATPDSRWTLGLRGTSVHVDLPAASDRPASDSRLNNLSGDLGYRYRLKPGLSLHANVAQGFRAPNIFDLGTLGPRPDNRFNVPNPELEPERILGTELGLKSAGRRHQAEMFLYWSDYRDKIVSAFTGQTTADGEQIVRSENANRVRLYGVEAAWRLPLAPALSLDGKIDWVWGEERAADGDRQPADRIPPLSGRLALDYSASASLSLLLEIRAAARQDRLSERDRRDSRIDPSGSDGWATANLGIAWDGHGAWRAQFRLDNILDEAYREHASGIDAPGRDARLMLEYHWQ